MQNINTFIKENIKQVSIKNIFVAPEIPEKKLNNAVKAMGLIYDIGSIIAIYDNTLFGSSDEGLAFTGEKFVYKRDFVDPVDLVFSEIKTVEYATKQGSDKEYIEILFKDGKVVKIENLFQCKYDKLAELLNKAITEFDSFEAENQMIPLSEMAEELKVAYVKIIINMAFDNDGVVDKQEFSEILLLMSRLELSNASRFELRNYIASTENHQSLELLLEQIDKHGIVSLKKEIKVSLVKDLINTHMSINEQSYKEFEFLTVNQALFGVSDEEIELIVMTIELDYKMLQENFDDDALTKSMKELTAKAGAVGLPLAAVYLSGSVIGMSAAGMTSGLATLGLGGALGFSSMATGIGVAVLIGVGAYKGIKHFTGANELDKIKRRELMLNEVIKQTQSTISLLIGDLNYITIKFNDAVTNHGLQDTKVKKLMQMMTALTGAADVLSKKSDAMQNSCIKLRCPVTLDHAKLKSLTAEPVKQQFYNIVMSDYETVTVKRQEDDKTIEVEVIKIKKDISTKDLDKLAGIFDVIGYYKAADVIKGKLSGIFS